MTLSYARIAKSKDVSMKFELRLKLVQLAAEVGIKPAARRLGCQPKTVRKWLRRWQGDHHSRQALADRSRAPKFCPHKISGALERLIVRERQKAPCLGPQRLRDFCAIPAGCGAIARVLRQHGLARKRKKKHEKKRDLRELKARFKPFEEIQVDTKHLYDIPFYVEQLWRNPHWPRFEYTARDVKTGAVFLGFAREISEAHACCFIAALGAHLRRCDFDLPATTFQTDNGPEFSGQERKLKTDRGFHYTVEEILKAHHRFIPPGRKNRQADVESLHERIEAEFFDLETFANRSDVFTKASAWQLWFNTTRKNAYKHHQSPDDILRTDIPQPNPNVWLLPALDLDLLLEKRVELLTAIKDPTGGYYVPALPAS